MTGYLFTAIIVLIMGFYFMVYSLNGGYPYFGYTLSSLPLILAIAVPILTMKSFAEDRKTKTDQMLMTYPVSILSIVLGKFLSLVTVVAVPTLISCICPIIIGTGGNSFMLSDYSAILAFFLMAAMFVSIGVFMSSLTDNQIIAAVLTFAVLLALCLWPTIVSIMPLAPLSNMFGLIIVLLLICLVINNVSKNQKLTVIVFGCGLVAIVAAYLIKSSMFESLLSNVLGAVSPLDILYNFTRYFVFDLAGLIFYLSVTALFLFLAGQSIQKRRWS